MGKCVSRCHKEPTMDLLEEHILKTLKELKAKEFEDFKVHLQHPDIFVGLVPLPPLPTPDVLIPQLFLEKNNKQGIAHLIVLSYPSHAPQIMVNVLTKIHRNDLLDRFPHTSKAVTTSDQHEATDADPPMSSSTSTSRGVSKAEESTIVVTTSDQHEATDTDLPMSSSTSTSRGVSKAEAVTTSDQHEATDADPPMSSSTSASRGVSKAEAVTPDQDAATDADEPMSSSMPTSGGISKAEEKHFVDQHRRYLIQNVTMVSPILDLLLQKAVITQEGYNNVRSKTTTQETMRELYALLKSRKAKNLFYEGLEEHEKPLLVDLRAVDTSETCSLPVTSPVSGPLVNTSGLPITYYEGQLQDNMDSTFVKLGTAHEVKFEKVFIPLHNLDIKDTDIHSHHEVRQMEMKKAGEGTLIQLCEMNKDPSGRNIRTVLTTGCAGIGKTFLVQKFLFDWAKKCFPQDPHLVFPLKFRQLNLLKGQNFTLAKLMHKCIKETRCIEEDVLNDIFKVLQKSGDYNRSPFKVMIVMDGFDENNFQFDFKTDFEMNVVDSYPVGHLLVNLIKGELLPSARMWITSRPAAVKQIPKRFVDRMTEVRGFIKDDQKKDFFTKSISDENQASSIYSHIKKSKILHTMCEIPVFCWILATVVQNMGRTDRLPKTLVEMYCHFLLGETQREKMKDPKVDESDNKEKLLKDAAEVLLKLGRLAFDQLEKGNIVFYEKDLKACGLDVNISLYSGLCTTFFKEDDVFFNKTVYCFVHLSIQEFLAAVYLFHCFTQRNMEVLKTFLGTSCVGSLSDFLKAAMTKTMTSESGHLDLFVRFLHGLSLQSNQRLLGGLLGDTDNSPEEIQKATSNLKKMNDSDFSPDRCINIFHCLMEMNDPSVSQGIQQYLESESRSGKELSETQCSALASMLQMSEEVLEELDLDKYNTDVLARPRLIPAVRNCTTARLVGCNLQKEDIEVVASALSSNPSHLRHLDISYNHLGNYLHLLCDALKSPNCRLETLRLMNCWLSETSCEVLASTLRSNPSHLRELDLTFNVLPVSALKNFSGLETLNVKHGGELWTNPQLLTQYFHRLTLDPNTASRTLCLSDNNRKATKGVELQSYPDHPDRFEDEYDQVLCTEGLSGSCYLWEVERSEADVRIGVSYRRISRRGEDSALGENELSWSLYCGPLYGVIHNNKTTYLPDDLSDSNRVAVYLDCPAGTLSFYDVSCDSLTHLYTFQTTFTEPLYPGFGLDGDSPSVSLGGQILSLMS